MAMKMTPAARMIWQTHLLFTREYGPPSRQSMTRYGTAYVPSLREMSEDEVLMVPSSWSLTPHTSKGMSDIIKLANENGVTLTCQCPCDHDGHTRADVFPSYEQAVAWWSAIGFAHPDNAHISDDADASDKMTRPPVPLVLSISGMQP